jgi:hypothetical protein
MESVVAAGGSARTNAGAKSSELKAPRAREDPHTLVKKPRRLAFGRRDRIGASDLKLFRKLELGNWSLLMGADDYLRR